MAAKATLALLATAACAGVVSWPALAAAQVDTEPVGSEAVATLAEPDPTTVTTTAAPAPAPQAVAASDATPAAPTRATEAPAAVAGGDTEAPAAVAGGDTDEAPPIVPPTVAQQCWLGGDRPIFVLRNQDPARSMRYSMRAAGQARRGELGPLGSGSETAWFVGAGSYPTATPVEVHFELGGDAGDVRSAGSGDTLCTYDVQPVVRWVDEHGDDIQPSTADLAGWRLTLESALETLTCGWTAAGLDCDGQARPGAPFPLRGVHRAGDGSSLQVPAFGDTSYTVSTDGLPKGYEVAGGDGATVLDDVAAGLDQATVDSRAGFFQAQLTGTGAARAATVTVQRIPEATVSPAAVTVANERTTPTTRALRLGSGAAASAPWVDPSLAPAPFVVSATPATSASSPLSGSAWDGATLPATGTDVTPPLVVGGVALLAAGAVIRRMARASAR